MDGTGQRTEYSYPINQEEVDFVKGKEKIKKYVSWLWPLALLLWYISSSFVAALVYLVVWLIGKIVVNKIMNNKIQEQLENSKAKRRAGANRL